MKKRLYFFLFWILLLRGIAGETDFDIDTKIFIPPVYYIGDEVELKLKIRLLDNNVKITIPEKLPAEQWIEINRITWLNLPRDVVTFNIFFVTFKPGKHILPSLNLGDVILEGIEVDTQSVTEKMDIKNISPKRAQSELPGTHLKIFLLILFILLVPVGCFFLIKYAIMAIRKMLLARGKELPKNRIKKALQLLLKKMEQMNSREFYIQLADITRNYLAGRFLIPALTLTTRELMRFFQSGIQDKELQKKITPFTGILHYSDLVKFGGIVSSSTDKISKIEEIMKIVDLIEEVPENVES